MQELELYTACPLCDCTDLADLRTASCAGHGLYNPALNDTLLWRTCAACGHQFRSGFYTDEACQLLFSGTHTTSGSAMITRPSAGSPRG